MADTILGLPSSKKFADESDRFYNHRRQILKSYPNGKATLTGILSMLPEEEVNDSIYTWYEKRYSSPKTTTRGTNPMTTDAPSTGDADDGTVIVAGAKGITTDFYLKVASTVDLKTGHVLRLDSCGDIYYVLAVTRGVATASLLGYVKVRLVRAETVAVADFASGTVVRVIGSAYGEGASGTGKSETGFKRPYAIQNTTQIFEDHMTFPGSVLQMGLKYDKTGPYRERAHDLVTEHMTSIERALLFGKRATVSRASFDTAQEDLSVRHFSGILEFLELWDAGSTGLSIDGATYAPYSFKGASTSDTDDQKRIITNAAGTVSVKKFNQWAEKVGRYHTNKTDEKLVLCGSGALIAMVDLFRMNTQFKVEEGNKVYGLTVTTIVTPFGRFNLVTHPLFTEDTTMTYWMLFLDVWNLKYRYLANRDTRLLKNQQNNGDDFRKDTFRTECGLEFWMPESHMLVKNVQNYIES
jgi:hypothetical protein